MFDQFSPQPGDISDFLDRYRFDLVFFWGLQFLAFLFPVWGYRPGWLDLPGSQRPAGDRINARDVIAIIVKRFRVIGITWIARECGGEYNRSS